MKRILTSSTLLLFAVFNAGCNQPTITESKQEAYTEWANSRVKIYYSLAQDQYKNGQLEKARNKALEAIALDDTHTGLRMLLGKIYIEEGNYRGAVTELKIATDQMPKSSEAFYLLGVAYEKNHQPEEAITSYNHSFELDRNNIAPVEALSEVLVSLDEVPQAQQYLETNMNQKDAQASTCELAGRIAMLLKQYDKAVGYFQRACDADTKNHRYPELLATAQFRNRKYQAAAVTIETMLKKKDYKPLAMVYEIQGDCYLALQQNRQAETAYREACKLRSENVETWIKLAKSTLLQDKTIASIHAAQQARRLEASSLEANMILGYAMLLDGNFTAAISVLEKSLTIHAGDPMLICLLGKAYEQSGQKEKARRLFARAMQAEPKNIVARELLASSEKAPQFSAHKPN